MKLIAVLIPLLTVSLMQAEAQDSNDVKVAGAMRNTMWNGKLNPVIELDTIMPRNGLYGLGPLSYLKGELMILDGTVYVSRVVSEDKMSVSAEAGTGAPFFVYAHANAWTDISIPRDITDLTLLNKFMAEQARVFSGPFVFRIVGEVNSAIIHVQNLPEGSNVSSPEEAHQGQVDYEIKNERVEILGFYSEKHQGVFTHHDAFTHMHLITKDKSRMGHLDQLELKKGTAVLYLPVTP